MTEAEILAMPAGRKLDYLVAGQIMGYITCPRTQMGASGRATEVTSPWPSEPPHFSTDMAAAWQVVEKLIANGCNLDVCHHENFWPGGKWRVYWQPFGPKDGANADTAPLAICRAALLMPPRGAPMPDPTTEQILALPAGRELNAMVAERVMGYTRHDWRGFPVWEWPGFHGSGVYPDAPLTPDRLPPYSTDIAAAWQVVERLGGFYALHTSIDGGWHVVWRHGDEPPYLHGDTAPLAICRAALFHLFRETLYA